MTSHDKQQLDNLMNNLDFHRVTHTMRLLKWRWVSTEGFAMSDEACIRANVRDYARQAIRQTTTDTGYQPGHGFIGTAGFQIKAHAEAGRLTYALCPLHAHRLHRRAILKIPGLPTYFGGNGSAATYQRIVKC